MSSPNFLTLDDQSPYELVPGVNDPRGYYVVGAHDFVFGRVSRLILSVSGSEVAYLVVATAMSNFPADKGEERLLPAGWVEMIDYRRQVRLPHLSALAFRRLPLYHPGGRVPERIDFPRPQPDEIEFWDIA